MTRTFLVWRYNTTRGRLLSDRPEVVEANSAQDAAHQFYYQALVVEAEVGDPVNGPAEGVPPEATDG